MFIYYREKLHVNHFWEFKGLKVLSFPFLSLWGEEGGWGQLFLNCRLLHFCCTKAAIPTQILPWGGWGTFFKTLYCYISVEPSPEYQHKFYQGEEGAVFSKPYPAAFLLTQAHNTNINFTCGSGYNKVKLEKVLQKQTKVIITRIIIAKAAIG